MSKCNVNTKFITLGTIQQDVNCSTKTKTKNSLLTVACIILLQYFIWISLCHQHFAYLLTIPSDGKFFFLSTIFIAPNGIYISR